MSRGSASGRRSFPGAKEALESGIDLSEPNLSTCASEREISVVDRHGSKFGVGLQVMRVGWRNVWPEGGWLGDVRDTGLLG